MEYHENVIEWVTGQDRITLTLHQAKHVNKVRKLKENFPDMVDITENKDGTIYATMPLSALRLTISVMSDSEAAKRSREAFAARRRGETE